MSIENEFESLKARHSELWLERRVLVANGGDHRRIAMVNGEIVSLGQRIRKLKMSLGMTSEQAARKFVPLETKDWALPTNATPILIEKLNAIGSQNPTLGFKLRRELLRTYNEFAAQCGVIRRSAKYGESVRRTMVELLFRATSERIARSNLLGTAEARCLLSWYGSMISALRFETERRIHRQVAFRAAKRQTA